MKGGRRKFQHRKNIIFLTAGAVLCIIICMQIYSSTVNNSLSFSEPILIIDPGHGGLDGGAVSSEGVCEQAINLAIGNRISKLAIFCGMPSIMTRYDENSLNYNPQRSISSNKSADLVARAKIAKANPQSDFVSIHLNKFTDSRYFGAQVFYRKSDESKRLAQELQKSLYLINADNNRLERGVPNKNYIMENIKNTGVIVECGFLSNQNEASLLGTQPYQKKLALLISSGYMNYKFNAEKTEQ